MQVQISIPVHTVSESNQRGGWWTAYNRKKRQQAATLAVMTAAGVPRAKPKAVHFLRQGKRRLDPDAVGNSNKHVQDAVCAYLGCSDGDETIQFSYDQEKAKEYAVVVTITWEAQ